MLTHDAIIDRLGGPHKLAAALTACGVQIREVTARAWHMRRNIPARYWTHVRSVSAEAGYPVTLDELARPITASVRAPTTQAEAA